MTKWVLIVYIATDLWTPMLVYDSAKDCSMALAQWEFQPGVHGVCLEAIIEPEKKHRRRK